MSVISLRNAVIVAGALAIMGAGKTLVLNANELDLQYQKLVVPKGSLHAPVLGAAYALDHSTGKFRPTKICNLFVGGNESGPEDVSFTSLSLVAIGWNGAMDAVTDYVGDKIVKSMKFSDESAKWEFQKRFWSAHEGMSFRSTCRSLVEETAANPNYSVFLVETIFFDPVSDEKQVMVQMSQTSVVFDGCEDACPKPVSLQSVLKVGWLARSKGDWGIVRIH
ncbi:hypothetical protein D1823_09540 [Ruegeria sp. AD91A]|uniref:hypothetical protein n=1 Tax=Ruegeria sp. AD91A TaxID=2293862 RepID=UPI000E466716|nr:hypothetical protein [Ruegeria sp. AD91A]AXT26806.1 hypothetical protein D1823_09540 [Ruegeria sp. AD91A]